MSIRSIPSDLLPWALSNLSEPFHAGDAQLVCVAGDASNRRYFRLGVDQLSVIVVEAPPETEKNPEFIAIANTLSCAGVRVPQVLASDLSRGYLLLEDLGDVVLLPLLNTATVGDYYGRAFDTLLKLADIDISDTAVASMPRYDKALLTEELGRFPHWFVEQLLGHSLTSSDHAVIQAASDCLIASALEQPQVLVHRDFHSRNLMLQGDGQLAVIDFQDAVVGPVTYDLVSLLRDCYIRWPVEQVRGWALDYRRSLEASGQLASSNARSEGEQLGSIESKEREENEFLRWLDLMGLQRHIKVLGTFARLYLRDGKSAYLDDLPMVLDYVRDVLREYQHEPALAEFARWFEATLDPLIAQRPWSADT
ncbi:MAG: phosphotransferase [Halioglobus sp.]